MLSLGCRPPTSNHPPPKSPAAHPDGRAFFFFEVSGNHGRECTGSITRTHAKPLKDCLKSVRMKRGIILPPTSIEAEIRLRQDLGWEGVVRPGVHLCEVAFRSEELAGLSK